MKIKTASPVCGICKTRGHFRLDCPQLPNLQRHVDLDQPPEDPSEDPIITWAQARDKMNEKTREKAARIIRRTNGSRKKRKRKKAKGS